MVGLATGLACTVFVLLAAIADLRQQKIPNLLVMSGTATALAANAWSPDGIGFGAAAAGLAVGLAVFLPGFLMRLLGAGDVKLIAMLGAFLGFGHLLGALLATFLAGGLLAVVFAWRAGRLGMMAANLRLIVFGTLMRAALPGAPTLAPPAPAVRMPYGVAIAAGTLLYLLWLAVLGGRS